MDQIEDPLLVAQGGNDPRVPITEAEQMVNAMVEENIPVTYLLFPDEGHGFTKSENKQAYYAAAESFLAQDDCLGGRTEPPGDIYGRSSLEVPEGAGLVPGLGEAAERPVNDHQ